MTEKDLDRIKKDLRSVLMVPNGLTQQRLVADYEALIGGPLKFREFGFRNPLEFFRSMPDVLISKINSSGVAIYRAVSNAETAHITNMISKQKPSTSGYSKAPKKNFAAYPIKPAPSNVGNCYRPKPIFERPPQQQPQYPTQQQHYPPQQQHYPPQQLQYPPQQPQHPPQQPQHPPQQPQQSLHNQNKERPSEPEKISKQIENNIIELLEENPSGVMFSKLQQLYNKKYNKLIDVTTEVVVKNMPFLFVFNRNAIRHISLFDPESEKKPSPPIKTDPPTSIQQTMEVNYNSSANNNKIRFDSEAVPDKIQEIFLTILEENPNGIYATHFFQEYKEKTGNEIDPTTYGFQNLLQLVGALSDVFSFTGKQSEQGDVLLQNARKNVDQGFTSSDYEELANLIKHNIIDLLKDAKYILLRNLETIYKDKIGFELCWNKMNYSSVEEMLHEFMRDIPISIITKEDSREKYVCIAPRMNANITRRGQGDSFDYNKDSLLTLPKDVYITTEYSVQEFPEGTNFATYQSVYVTHVNNPYDFYIQISNFVPPIEDLMENLSITYGQPEAQHHYMIPPDLIQINMVCVAIWPVSKEWHRAVVIGMENPDLIEVFYMDYGTTSFVNCDHVCFIKQEFMTLPAQALKCKLSGIKSYNPNGSWSNFVRRQMTKYTENIVLAAYIKNRKQGIYTIFLCNVTGENDLHINDMLVEQNLAQYIPDEEEEMEMSANNVMSCNTMDNDTCSEASSGDFEIAQDENDELQNTVVIGVNLKPRYVKRIFLMDKHYPVHLINHDGDLYLTNKELSLLFWNKKIVKSVQCIKDIKFPHLKVLKKNVPELFAQLKKYNVPDISQNQSTIVIFPMKSVLFILYTLGHAYSEELTIVLLENIKGYQPQAFDWQDYQEDEAVEEVTFTRPPKETIEDLSLFELMASIHMAHRQRENYRNLDGNDEYGIDELLKNQLKQYEHQKKILEATCKDLNQVACDIFNC